MQRQQNCCCVLQHSSSTSSQHSSNMDTTTAGCMVWTRRTCGWCPYLTAAVKYPRWLREPFHTRNHVIRGTSLAGQLRASVYSVLCATVASFRVPIVCLRTLPSVCRSVIKFCVRSMRCIWYCILHSLVYQSTGIFWY